jgi:hypothetical protein
MAAAAQRLVEAQAVQKIVGETDSGNGLGVNCVRLSTQQWAKCWLQTTADLHLAFCQQIDKAT